MKLTAENYYSVEANQEYWSASTIKEFLSCPARALAEITGNYIRPETPALLIGSYVDAYFEGTLPEFKLKHPEIFKRDGNLRSDFIKADEMINRATSDSVFMEYMQGKSQVIKTGEIGGLPFRCKFDKYIPKKRIVDLKTARDMLPAYRPGEGKVSFADAWHWSLQMAIYQRIEGHNLPCYLAVITKQDPPDIAVIQIPQETLDAEIAIIEQKLPYFDAIKQGIIEAPRCENCAYCRMTRKLTKPIPLTEFYEIGDKETYE